MLLLRTKMSPSRRRLDISPNTLRRPIAERQPFPPEPKVRRLTAGGKWISNLRFRNALFNPVYGQGMSGRPGGAITPPAARMRKNDPLAGLALAFFDAACGLIETPWAVAASAAAAGHAEAVDRGRGARFL